MKRRKGMTIVEVVVALLLMGLAFIVIGRLTGSRIAQTEGLEYQFDMRAADGYMYGIYQDFHNCNSYTNESSGTGDQRKTTLTFDLGTEGVTIYEFRTGEHKCYYNNIEQFDCTAFTANGNDQFLYVSVQLDSGQRLEYQIYK